MAVLQEENDTHSHQEEEAPDASPPPSAAPENITTPHLFQVKQRLRHAVTVANVLAQQLKDQKKLGKKDFHLLLLTEQVKEMKRNPGGCPGPTPAQQKEAREKEWARQARQEREHEKWVRLAERRKVANEP
jgi:hypothetical protein